MISKDERNKLFDDFIENEAVSVKRLCYSIAFDTNDAVDFYQECLIKIYKNIHRYDESRGASLKTWTCTISRNLIYDAIRKEKLHTKHLMSVEDVGIYETKEHSEKVLNPEDIYLKKNKERENRKLLVGLINRARKSTDANKRGRKNMTAMQRKILRKYFFYDIGYRDIAKTLGISYPGVRRSVCMMRKRFRADRDKIKA